MKTADGYEFDMGRPAWRNESDRQQWETVVNVIDGDKRFTLTVVTPGAIKGTEIAKAVQKSMEQWSYKGAPMKAAKVG